ncbi:MAG: hypothetical protein IJM82_01950 [Synergistaceae bacterium]|nr:hypothetical protein [Synergistaceae bacterium]
MKFLPNWNSNLYIEISPFFPLGRDYQPVSVNRFFDDTLKNIAESCLNLEGEFFFMASPWLGCVGNLPRENFFRYKPDNVFNLGFLMVLGYSELLEKAVMLSLTSESAKGLMAGLTSCALWNRGVFRGNSNVIVIAADDPLYDCTEYLKKFDGYLHMVKEAVNASDLAFYAEKFGYDRFFVEWEKQNPYDLRINQIISEFEYESSQEITGGSSAIDFPAFTGISVTVVRKNQREEN